MIRRLFRRLIYTMFTGAVLLVVLAYSAHEPLLVAIGRFVVSTDTPAKADAIVVLSGSLPDRILEAVDQFHAGMAPQIILIEERTRPGLEALRERGVEIPHSHDLNLTIATQLGVPRAAIVTLREPVNSTISEAVVVLRHLRDAGADSAMIVTSKMHSQRAGVIYRWLAGDSLEIRSTPSRYDPFTPETWWQSRGQTRRLVFEYQKLLVFWLRDRWKTPDLASR